jgi:hypothetical protein
VEFSPVEFLNFREFDQRKYGSTLLLFHEDSRPEDAG